MKQPEKMFKMKPLLNHNLTIELPNCMYQMKNVHGPKRNNNNINDGHDVDHIDLDNQNLDLFDKNHQEIANMAELEIKQNDILKQLEQLKEQIRMLKSTLNNQIEKQIECININEKHLPDNILIHVNPLNPPYSLKLIQILYQNHFALKVTAYVHSSIAILSKPAQLLQKSLENIQFRNNNIPKLNVQLIWKNTNSTMEFLLGSTLIIGEVNLLRYLARILKISPLNYTSYDDIKSFEIDSLLDQCYLLVQTKTKTARANILQLLSKSLGKSNWLMAQQQPGLLDIAAYSAIRQCSNENELGINLRYWYSRCESLIETQ